MISQWPPRVMAFLLWTLAALAATYWLMKSIGLAEAPVRAGTIAAHAPTVNSADLTRVLGPPALTPATAATTAAAELANHPASKMRLLGVVAGRRNAGVALIALEGQPARPYRVGSQVTADYRLTRVATRSATLATSAAGAALITLELAPNPAGSDTATIQAPVRLGLPSGQLAIPVPVLPPGFARPSPVAPAGPTPPAGQVEHDKD